MRGRATIRILALAAELLAAPGAFALNPALDISQYAHKAWKISEGFTRGPINTVAQTPDGYLWLGTEFGLVRFDGVQTAAWTPPEGQTLPSDTIRRLLVTRDGTLWIGTRTGLASWKGGRFSTYPELAGFLVDALFEDHEATVWAGAIGVPTGRLCAIRNGAVQCQGEDGSLGAAVVSLYEFQGDLWVGTGDGRLWRWRPGPPKVYPSPGPASSILDLIEGDDGTLWMSKRGGLLQLKDGRIEAYSLPVSGQFDPNRLLRDREGNLWIGTTGRGLLHWHQGRADVFTSADGLSGDTVQHLFEDREGNIWAATTDGLDRFRDFAVSTTSVKQGLSSGIVSSVLAARDGSVWVGTNDGLNRWNKGQITIYRKRSGGLLTGPAPRPGVREVHDEGLPRNAVQSLLEDSRGRIWVATLSGLAYFEDGQFHSAGSLPGAEVHSFAEDGAGDLWMTDQYRGLLHLRDGKLVELIPWEKLGHPDYAGPLVFDRAQGGLWLGFVRAGVAYFQDGRIRASYTASGGLGNGAVRELRLDRDGTLWAATDGGLSRLKNGRIATLTRKNGLPCDAVHATIEDNDHSLWLMMPCGLVRIARSELESWVAAASQPLPYGRGSESGTEPRPSGSGFNVRLTVFDSSDGVRSRAFPPGYSPRAVQAADGKLWFVSMEGGVSVVDPRHLPFNKLPPPVDIEQVTADRKTYAAGAKLRLPPLVRDAEIDYTALSFVAPEKMQFRYKLEGYDGEWHEAGNRRQAFYTNLGPRRYRFRVMASNNSGVWNEAGASLDFAVDPAYYQTRWFEALVACAILGLLAALYQLRLRYLKHQFNIRLEARVGERTRIARDLHDTLLQSFQGTLLKFHALSYLLGDHPQAKKTLENCIEQARAAIAEGREAVQELRSSVKVTNDLARAITTFGEGLASDQDGHQAPEFHVHVEGASKDLVPLVRDEVYRITGEALRNAFRHSSARRIEVEICYETRLLRVRVRDNGKGMDPQILAAGGRGGHHGLPGMRERAELVGGKLAVWSELNCGCEIELTIPAGLAYARSTEARSAGQTTG